MLTSWIWLLHAILYTLLTIDMGTQKAFLITALLFLLTTLVRWSEKKPRPPRQAILRSPSPSIAHKYASANDNG